MFDNPSAHQYRLEGFDWSNPGDGLTLTWSAASLNVAVGNWQASFTGRLTSAEVADVERAFYTWSSVANIHFLQVPDSPDVDIRIGIGAVAATYGSSSVGITLSSAGNDARIGGEQIEFDQGYLTHTKFDDQNVYALALHEIGHALGLDHSTNPNAIMAASNFFESSSLRTQLSPDDIAGIQALFGAPGTPTPAVTGTLATKGLMLVNTAERGAIALPGEMQYYKISLLGGQLYSFDMRANSAGNGTLSDPDLSIADSSGRVLGHATGGGSGLDAHIDFTAPATGLYYLEAQAVLGNDFGTFLLNAAGPAPLVAQAITPAVPPSGMNPAEAALIDTSYYLSTYTDIRVAGIDPAVHFASYGWHEGRNPDALFDVNYYLAHNPDVAATGIDPLAHYALYGWKEGRDPSQAFGTSSYLAHNADVRLAGIDPLQHYLQFGVSEGRVL